MPPSHLKLLKPQTSIEVMYGRVFGVMADQHASIELAAFELFEEAIELGLDLSQMKADGAFLQLNLAEVNETVLPIDGDVPPVDYIDSVERREKRRVRNALLGDGCDHDDQTPA
jgi:hypothetical protein